MNCRVTTLIMELSEVDTKLHPLQRMFPAICPIFRRMAASAYLDNLDVVYKPWKEHLNVDLLSRVEKKEKE